MRDTAAAETVVKMAVKNTHATVRKQNKPARNRRPVFKAWTVAKLLDAYKDPRAILLEIAGKDTKALAAEMQSSLGDALAERRLCAQAVLPYVAQKLPTQIDMRQTRAINLNILDSRQYEELVEVAASEDASNSDDSFSMQLIAAQPTDITTSPQARSETPVTPAVAADSPQGAAVAPSDRLAPESQWWNQVADGRRQRISDVPAGEAPDRWERSGAGTFAPGKPK